MSQSPVIMAFRKRMSSFGYTRISIVRIKDKDKNGLYQVSAYEPLGGNLVVVELDPMRMRHMFR